MGWDGGRGLILPSRFLRWSVLTFLLSFARALLSTLSFSFDSLKSHSLSLRSTNRLLISATGGGGGGGGGRICFLCLGEKCQKSNLVL